MNNDEYKSYVRRVSFDISLTGPQCMTLVAAYRKFEVSYGHFVPVIGGLIRKGFITHQVYNYPHPHLIGMNYTGKFSGERPAYILTAEGSLVSRLIESASIPEIENLLAQIKSKEWV